MYQNCLPIPPDMPSLITIKLPPSCNYLSTFTVSQNLPLIKISGGGRVDMDVGVGYPYLHPYPQQVCRYLPPPPPFTYYVYQPTITAASATFICPTL